MEAFGVLAGGLVHDFKNILSVLSGNITLGLSDKGVLEITRNRFQEMAVALDKGTALVLRLMQYIRKQPSQIRPVQVNEVANAVLDVMRPLLTNRVRVKVELSEGLPVVQADSSQVEQVLVNLILNALDAMPDGGKLTLGTELTPADGMQEEMNEERSAFVLITVADTGTGIPEHLQSRIFEPFFTTKPGKGAGLGLSSSQLILKRHHGRMEVQSTPGVGTKFSIYLPVQD